MKRFAHKQQTHSTRESGFITMIALMLLILAVAIMVAYKNVISR